MPDRPPFDAVRASFYLVAGVIAVHAIVVLIGMVACIFFTGEMIQGRFTCDKENRLSELLTSALAAALAFAGGFVRNREPPKKD